MAHHERKLPVPEGRKDKRRSFLPTPKSFAASSESPQDCTKQFSQPEISKHNLQVGDKVCIGGVKLGELKYFGKTHITGGLWCGIELYEAEGKHDGEVEGVRYFNCRQGHGIFAPIDKVSKIELVPHNVHQDVIEEEIEIPPEDSLEQKSSFPKPVRRLLPQPQVFVRRGSKEKVTIPSKIEEQNEDFDEVDHISGNKDTAENIKTRYLPKVDSRIRPPAVKSFTDSEKEQVCSVTSKVKEDSAFRSSSAVSSKTANKNSNNSFPTDMTENTSKKDADFQQSAIGSGISGIPKPSRLPAMSKIPYISKSEKPKPDIPTNSNFVYDTNTQEKFIDKDSERGILNRTYDIKEMQMAQVTDLQTTQVISSGEDSLSGEVQECLLSDRRHYLNLTFDMEGGNSPPQQNLSQSPSSNHPEEILINGHEDKTFDISANSSLGVLDIQTSQLDSDLLQEVPFDIVEVEKKSLLNLTDMEKLSKVTILPRRQDRIASLGDTFEGENAITSTPVVPGKKMLSKQYDHTTVTQVNKPKELSEVIEDVALNMNATYKIPEENAMYRIGEEIPVDMLGNDMLDWRQEASDGEEHSASSEESVGNKQTDDIVKREMENCVDSLTEKLGNMGITTDGNVSQTSLSLSKLPMIDSGISEQGDILTLEQDRMADSCQIRESEILSTVENLKNFTDGNELQLQADLIAGHLKKERPLSIVSSISADTGYVPDTDSERGTLTINSPLDWAEKMAQSAESGIGSIHSDLDQAYVQSFKNFQSAVLRGASKVHEESDSDICSDVGTVLAENDLGKEDSDFENMSGLLVDIKGISANEILPLFDDNSEKELQQNDGNETDSVPNAGETEEDERIEADQQLDKLNVTVDIVKGENCHDECGEEKEAEVVTPVDEETTLKVLSDNESEDNVSMTDETKSQTKNKISPKKRKEIEKVEHKKPNINVGSRVADYIKAPLPVKIRDENSESAKNKRNMGPKKKNNKLEDLKSKADKEVNEERKKREKIEKEPPKIIKRTPPKSKWGSIMSQIEANQSTVKPKSEIKSKIEAYLNTPPPPLKKDAEAPKEKKEKPKKKLPNVPTPDYSRVKSKLNIGAPTTAVCRESSPASGKRDHSPKTVISGDTLRRLSSINSNATSNMSNAAKFDLNDSVGSSVLGSAISSVRSSQSDLNGIEGGGESSAPGTPRSVHKPTNKTIGRIAGSRERRDSTSSTMSNTSQGSVKAINARNSRLSDVGQSRRKSLPVKSSIPPLNVSAVRKISQPSRSLDSSPSNRPLKNTKHGDGTKINSSCQENKKALRVKEDNKKLKGDNQKSPQTKKINNQNRNKTKTRNAQKQTNQQADNIPGPISTTHGKHEIERLEALCECRTKELTYARIQMKNNLQAFDAMTVMVQYLTQDLDAFSMPSLSLQVKSLKQKLEETQKQIEELQNQKRKLDETISQQEEQHLEALNSLKSQHEKQITWEKEKHEESLANYRQIAEEYHKKEVSHLKISHEETVTEMKTDHSLIIQQLHQSHDENILSLRNKQQEQMEELHKQHRDKLEDITHRFENIKMGLSEKVETLRSECDDLRSRAKSSEEALLRDSDVKVQMALAPYKHLPQEIESLKLVIEMRNEELQKYRNRNAELEKQSEELLVAREKIIAQQQKIENLEAIISMKTDHEKQLHDKCQMLMRKCDKESKANKRLSMDFEELVYKVNLTDPGSLENLSKLGGSPCHSETSSPAVRRKVRSPAFGEEKSPARNTVYRRSFSSSENSAEKKLKRRSATFLHEKDRTSPTGSPRHKMQTYSDSSSPPRSLHPHTDGHGRMALSCEEEQLNKNCAISDRLVQSCNDAEVFDTPQGLPNPVTPDDLKTFTDENLQEHAKVASAGGMNSGTVSLEISPSHDAHEQNGVELEEFEGEGLHIDTHIEAKDDASDLSHSTESYCPSSGTGSFIWDYEKMDSIKSMDSSQTSQTSETMLDSSTLTDTMRVDNSTLTNIKDITNEESDTSSGFVENAEDNLVIAHSPSSKKAMKESTV